MQPTIDRPKFAEHEQPGPAWLLDLLLGVAVTLVIALVISADQGGRRDADALAYLFAVAFGGLMLMRRQLPVAVLVATMSLLFAYYTLGYPAIGLAVPVSAALYSAAERSRLSAAIVVSAILVLVSTYFRLQDGESAAYLLSYEFVSTATLMAAAIALGDSTRARRELRAAQAHTARLIEQEHAYRAEQRVQAERVRMARDLHDVVGHSIAVISLHAGVAGEALGADADQARQALANIRSASAATMRELRATVRLLRAPADDQTAAYLPSLAHLEPLVDNVAASGVRLTVDIAGEVAELPATVDAAAYRIAQEALTNIIRHARATEAALAIEVAPTLLRLRITDNGRASTGPIPAGSGLQGMRERARLLGGTLTAQACPSGGFEVAAELPLKERT